MALLRTVKYNHPHFPGEEPDQVFFGEIGVAVIPVGVSVFVDMFNSGNGLIFAKLGLTATEARLLADQLTLSADHLEPR